jgi:SRSO17 transposase
VTVLVEHFAAAAPVGEGIDPLAWASLFEEMFAEVVAPAFVRREPRLRARAYLLGLVSGLERKNGWTLAEFAGDATPDGMQRLLNAACWDEDAVRDALGRYVAARLGDPAAVLIADETGFEKSGQCSAGVQRQYTGTAGKITNCQIGVFLAYAVPGGARTLIDRELYVPRSWTGDRDRCDAAGIPEDTGFATKPQLARVMIERAVAAGIPFAWFTADEAYGDNGPLREWLEESGIAYVVAVACDHRVPAGAGRVIRADKLAAMVPAAGWQRVSCGPGSKGERFYDWALADAGPGRYLLIRRSLTSGELAFYRCWAPSPVTLAALVRVAGARWAVEECFAAAKNETALDHYQVRKHAAWYRHVTLAMCAHAWLAVTAAASRPPPAQARGGGPGHGDPAREGAGCLWTTIRPGTGKLWPLDHRQQRRRPELPHCQRDPPPARDLLPSSPPGGALRALVAVAAPPPGACPLLPLPAAAQAPVFIQPLRGEPARH